MEYNLSLSYFFKWLKMCLLGKQTLVALVTESHRDSGSDELGPDNLSNLNESILLLFWLGLISAGTFVSSDKDIDW